MRPPCLDFAPDSLGDDPAICIKCLWDVGCHYSPFALGWDDGFAGLTTGITFDSDPSGEQSAQYDSGRNQGEVDYFRSHI